MFKVGEFIYPWGSGHYSRMMRFHEAFLDIMGEEVEFHFASKDPIYQKLVAKFPAQKNNIYNILMPTPIDGKYGPSLSLSMLNFLLPVANNPPLVKQIVDYLKEERKLYNREKFDLVINDGDMGSNILARNRSISCLFITNQFRPKLFKSRSYFYPSLYFISKQIAKASKILVADSPPPYTLCEYNLNFTKEIEKKVTYVGHFTKIKNIQNDLISDLERLIENSDFGYWIRTGNKSTNDGTGEKFEGIFHQDEMKKEKRIISHGRDDSSIDCVLDKDRKKYSISEALEKKIDWIQIDVGYLSETEKEKVLNSCRYAVVNGSHTVMGEILRGKSKPIIGIPVYDEHENNIKWAEKNNLGILAKKTQQVLKGIKNIKENYDEYKSNLIDFSKNFVSNGAENTAKIASEILEEKR